MAAMFREFRIAKEGVSGAWAAEGCVWVWVWVWVREREKTGQGSLQCLEGSICQNA